MKPITIHGWGTCYLGSPYMAPEVNPIGVKGYVAPGDDPRYAEGGPITTSAIVAVEGRIVTTRSGTRYRLACPHPAFLASLRKMGRAYNREQPITIKTSRAE